jgi:hypothetical protein
MIANLVFNRDPATLAHYACKEEKQAEVLVAHGVRSWSAEAMAADFEAQRAQRPKLGRCMLHVALAWPAEEQARLTNDLMRQLAHEYLTQLGIDPKTTQWALIRHGDRDHPHAHLLLNRVTDTGSVISDTKCYERSGQACRQLERQHALRDAAAIGREQQVAKAAAGGLEAYPAAVAYISEAMHRHLPATSTAPELARALASERVPIAMHCTYNEQQQLSTVVFEREGHFVKSSRLSRELSGPKLEKYFTQQRQIAAEAAAEQQQVARLAEAKVAAQFKEVLLAALAKQLPAATSVPGLVQALAREQVIAKPVLQPDGQVRELVLSAVDFPGRKARSGELTPEYSGEALTAALARQAAQHAMEQRTAGALLAASFEERQQLGRWREEASRAEEQGDYRRIFDLREVEIPAAETRFNAYQALLKSMPAGRLLLQQAAEQEQQQPATRQAAEQAAAEAQRALRAQLLPLAEQALANPFKPNRETWHSWSAYTAQVEKAGFRFREERGLLPQLQHVASGENFDLTQVQPGGPSAPPLRQQVAKELREQGAAQTQAERMLERVLASRNFTSESELTEQLRELGYQPLAQADNRHWLCHEASGRQFRLAELRPNGLPLARQVQEVIASRQAEQSNGRISVWAGGSVSALERTLAMQQRLEAAGAQVFLDYIPDPATGRAVVLGYRHALRGPQLAAINHELRLIQTTKGTLVREQDSKVSHQPVDKWPPREGEFGQVTLVLHDNETRRATERAAHARQLLQKAGALIRTVTPEPGGAVALEIGYHSRQPDLPALSQLLDKWRTVPGLEVRETAAARQAHNGKSFLSPAALGQVASTPTQEAATPDITDYEHSM